MEREALGAMLGDVFGYQLLQLGEYGGRPDYLEKCPIRRRILLGGGADVEGVLGNLQFFGAPRVFGAQVTLRY